jgi:hypothetical protein
MPAPGVLATCIFACASSRRFSVQIRARRIRKVGRKPIRKVTSSSSGSFTSTTIWSHSSKLTTSSRFT